jgi:hypothetical protein
MARTSLSSFGGQQRVITFEYSKILDVETPQALYIRRDLLKYIATQIPYLYYFLPASSLMTASRNSTLLNHHSKASSAPMKSFMPFSQL